MIMRLANGQGVEGTMLVAHVVDRNVPTVHPEDDILSAARRLLSSVGRASCPSAPGEADARVVGLLRCRDAFIASYGRANGTDALPVAAAMSPAAPSAACPTRSDSRGGGCGGVGLRRCPSWTLNGYLVGVLSFADLMRAAAR